jgi:hypothetical protein
MPSRLAAPAVVAFASVICLFGAGCGGGGPAQPASAAVKGVVNLDNKPMDSGEVMFTLPGEVPDTIPVKSGTFEGKAKIGKAKVEIRSYRPGKKNEMYPDQEPSPENFIPARYNSESKDIKEITKDGPNEFKFDVTSK